MCPRILKMHQERFLTKCSFFARSPTNELQGFASAEGASEEKLAILREILPQIYPKMLFSKVSPCYAIFSPLYRLNYKVGPPPTSG